MKNLKLTELNRLDNLNQDELFKLTGGAKPVGGGSSESCCCSCPSCCTDESCGDRNDAIVETHDGKVNDSSVKILYS